MKCLSGIIAIEDDNKTSYDEKNGRTAPWRSPTDVPGFGKKYRVRIEGRHPENAPASSLPVATCLYPTTAGSGHEASYQTANLKPGARVKILEEEDGTLIIFGCLANNEQVNFNIGPVPDDGFAPFGRQFTIPEYNIPGAATEIVNVKNFGNFGVNAQYLFSNANKIEFLPKTTALATPTTCEKAPIGAIQITIKNFITEVTEAKLWLAKQKLRLQNPLQNVTQPVIQGATVIGGATSSLDDLINGSSGITTDTPNVDFFNKTFDNSQLFNELPKPTAQSYSIDNWLNTKINNVSKQISKWLKDIISQIQTGITNKINNLFKDLYYTLFPKQLQEVKEKVETFMDLVSCLFRRIVSNLFKMVAKFLQSAVDYVINPANCIVENFIGGLLGKILGLITSAINALLQPLNAVLGIIDIGSDILSIVENLLSSLSCEEKPLCPKIQEWSAWDGPVSVFSDETDNLSGLFSKIQSFAGNVQDSIDPDNFDFDLDFSDVFQDTCNVGAIACGPPTVSFLGGGGSGAAGNPIVNALGEIIGVDITNSGTNYTSAPTVKFNDACGKGSGAIARAVIGTAPIPFGNGTFTSGTTSTPSIGIGTTTTTGIDRIIIEDPGSGYLPVPDGSYGANGITITPPITTSTSTYPSGANGAYPVIMKLCEIVIENSGFGYATTDTISIEPSNGATARPYFTPTGSIYRIEVISKGEGFKVIPTVTINSQTGTNAVLIPRLCSERVGDDLTITTTLDKIINVVDCPGR